MLATELDATVGCTAITTDCLFCNGTPQSPPVLSPRTAAQSEHWTFPAISEAFGISEDMFHQTFRFKKVTVSWPATMMPLVFLNPYPYPSMPETPTRQF